MASAYLEKTFANNGNRKTMTFSFWMKVSKLNTNMYPMSILDSSSGNQADIRHSSVNQLRMYATGTDSTPRVHLVTNRVLTDLNAWYHIVWQVDTTQATESNRVKLYINGIQETSFGTETYPAQNIDLRWNGNNSADQGGVTQVGAVNGNGDWDGSLAHFHFIDGTAYPASTFGETDTTTGIWKPKTSPSVTYGSNGFFLKFDNSANMGVDSSGNSNNFTTTGTIIQNKDTPSNIFATLNPNARRITTNDPTYSNTNSSLQGQTGNGQNNNAIATLGDLAKGKYYFECKVGTVGDDFGVGVSDTPDNTNGVGEGNHEIFYKYDGTKWNGSGYTSYGATYTTGDIIGCAFDVTAGTISFYKNGVSQGTAATDLASSLVHGYTPIGYTNKGLMHFNFGNGYFGTTAVSSAQNPTDGVGIFEYTPPTNYRAVCTKSINAQEYS